MEKDQDKIKNLSGGDIQTLTSMLTTRANLAASLGQSYGGDRDVYQALGYPTELLYSDYTTRYTRQDIAKAIIDRPVKATWQGDLEIIETDDAEVTPFEKEWKKLDLDLKITSKLTRVDRLTGIGQYGIVLLGLDDVKKPDDFANEVKIGKRKLLYIKPFGEGNAKISTFEENPTNPRYERLGLSRRLYIGHPSR